MSGELLPGIEAGAAPRRRGRPKGATNRRAEDLIRMIGAVYGSTPGEQAARIGLVTPKEVRLAKREARELGLDPVIMALVVKARALAKALKCKTDEAWAILARERAELMPYVHQKRPIGIEVAQLAVPRVLIPEALGPAVPVLEGDYSVVEEDQILSDLRPVLVGRDKSDDEA